MNLLPAGVTEDGVIVGTGLIARAFTASALFRRIRLRCRCFQLSCEDPREFERERHRLSTRSRQYLRPAISILQHMQRRGPVCAAEAPTCSIKWLAASLNSASAISSCACRSWLDIPPITYVAESLCSRIVRSERFRVWRARAETSSTSRMSHARDRSGLVRKRQRETINIANTHSFSVLDIVKSMEDVLTRPFSI
jgi:hypothetical protein